MSEVQEQACSLRRQGLSITAISKQLHVPRSSVHLWVKSIELTDQQRYQIALTTGNHRRKETKTCPKCGTADLAKFGVNTKRWDGLQVYCRECVKTYVKPRLRAYQVKHRYGLSEGEYDELLNVQNKMCALCGHPPRKQKLVIDHDHTTGKVRGLVHQKCNTLLGLADDDPERLKAAIRYLERNLTTPLIV